MDDKQHHPVLLEEALAALALKPEGIYVDATFGRGGHAREMLRRLGPAGQLLAFDRDPQAVEVAHAQFAGDRRFEIARGLFSMMAQTIENHGWIGKINGVLLDLGVSSPQLDDPRRGFSFRHEGPLDMRMDPDSGVSAADWINRAEESEISRVIRDYGEERFARRIARAICAERVREPIVTTDRLARIVAGAVSTREPGQNPATRTFQAIRLHINHELDELSAVLPQALDVLVPGGRLAVITFHSLEDRIVKEFMRREAKGDAFPPDLPVPAAMLEPRLRVVGKAIRPGVEELQGNPRARSAVLRVAEVLHG
ncbi:MAG: 16S rRNA (cytosine(1402)-N(4))-methyltransferase RsmH [Acidiferrobacterales bacterium]